MTARPAVLLEWLQKMPAEVRASAEPLIRKRLWRLPSWCHELSVRWDDDDAGTGARVTVDVEYRRAQIVVCPGFLTETKAERDRIIAHEMTHIPTLALGNLFDEAMALLPKEQRHVKAMLLERWRLAMEGATCDLTEAFERRDT